MTMFFFFYFIDSIMHSWLQQAHGPLDFPDMTIGSCHLSCIKSLHISNIYWPSGHRTSHGMSTVLDATGKKYLYSLTMNFGEVMEI